VAPATYSRKTYLPEPLVARAFSKAFVVRLTVVVLTAS
jgi:hypothetical protein